MKMRPRVLHSLLLAALAALLIKIGKGYAGFPAIDDFAYIPLTYRLLDASLYARDVLLQGYSFHLPLWAILVWLFEGTIGLAPGFWLSTVVLALATVTGAWGLVRSLGGRGLLFPLTAVLAFAARTPGLGRGIYGGAFGDSFHMQWMALCLLIWSYNGFVRGKPALAGVFLGLTTLAHPVVGAHGAFVILVASVLGFTAEFRNLLKTALITALVSSPVVVPQLLQLTSSSSEPNWGAAEIIERGYIFRTSQQFTLELTSTAAQISLLLLFVLAVAGALLIREFGSSPRLRLLLGLWGGHTFLLLATMVFHGPATPDSWKLASVVPYLFHLSRTTPIFVVLSSILAVSGLEAMFDSEKPGGFSARLLRMAFLVTLICFTAVFVEWNAWFLSALFLVFAGRPLARLLSDSATLRRIGATASIVLMILLLFRSYPEQLRASVSTDEQGLYSWVATRTSKNDLFIIPPGFQEFRIYSKRSVYADFKLFPASTPRLIQTWRERLEQITQPDQTALDINGWAAMYHWDRCYAQNNPPGRIASLLRETGADFFLQDQAGFATPPYLDIQASDSSQLQEVFSNGRFRLFRLKEAS